jgi:long-chain acyl-CoA synthetase
VTDHQYGLLAQAAARPDQAALILGDQHRTYADLDDRARRCANALAGLGVGRGDRVAVMLPNSFEWFEAVHGAGRLGAVVVPVNTHFKAAETGWVVADSGAAAAVVAADLAGSLADVAAVPRLVVGDGYEAALAASPATDPAIDTDCWPTTMPYTSGTTGRPKGVAIAEDDFRRTAAGFASMGTRWQLGPDDVHLLVGPAYHSGPAAWAQMHIAFGGTVVVMPKWDAEGCLALVQRHRVTNSHMVPANFIRILELPEEVRRRYDLSSLRVIVHAAAPCPVPVKRAFMDLVGPEKVWEYYGASEGGGTSISPDEWLAHPGSVGRPFPGNEFKIVADDGSPLPPGQVGTIYARTGHSSFRYHNDDEKTASTWRDGWFTVGDAGWLDADGYLYLSDRKADMVIVNGVNVYPREIEDALYLHPDVVDCAVFGVPDPRTGEALCAVVQPRAGASLSADDVIGWVGQRLADYKRPRRVKLVDELPRDPNGKVAKHRLRADYASSASSAATERSTADG